jgi:hypothetical protein
MLAQHRWDRSDQRTEGRRLTVEVYCRGRVPATPRNGLLTVRRLSVSEPEHLVLLRPPDRRIKQAGNADPMRQSTFDGGFDETRRKEREGDSHIDVALAAGLAIGNVVDGRGALGIERVEFLVEPVLGRDPGVDRTANPPGWFGRHAGFSARLRIPKKRGPDHRVPVMAKAISVRLPLQEAAIGYWSVSRNPSIGCDGDWRRHHRSPAVARRPAGQDS